MILSAEVGLRQIFQVPRKHDFLLFISTVSGIWRLGILCLNIVDINRAFSKYVEFNQAIDGAFVKHRRANVIIDSHSVIFSCFFFYEHLHIMLILPNPLLQLSSFHHRANVIMDSHSVIFSCFFFYEHLHIMLILPNPLLQLSS